MDAELFVSVLGASSYLYAEALRSQELIHWVSAHANAFDFYGGVPDIVVSLSKRWQFSGAPSPKIRDVLRLRLGDRLSLRRGVNCPRRFLTRRWPTTCVVPATGITSWPLPVVTFVCRLFQYSNQIHDPIRNLNGQR